MKSLNLRAEPIHFLEVLAFPFALLFFDPSKESLMLGVGLSILSLILKVWLFAYPKKKNKKFEVYGPYRFLRHPYFCSTLILIIAASIAGRSMETLLVFMTLFAFLFSRDAKKIDEKRKVHFGSDYTYYRHCISSLVPGVVPYPAATQKEPSLKNIFDVRYKAEIDTFITVAVFFSYAFAYSTLHDIRLYHLGIAACLWVLVLFRLGRLVKIR